MTRVARQKVTLYSFSLAFIVVPVWLFLRPKPAPILAAPPLPVIAPLAPAALLDGEGPVRPPRFKVLLIRAGLSAEALAAGGVASEAVASIVGAALDAMQGNPSALATLDATVASARASSDALRRKIQSGQAAPEDVTAYNAAMSALGTAEASRETLLAGVLAAATTNLSETQKTALTNLRANAHWNLKKEFMVVNHTAAEWVALRDALANERIAPEIGEEPNAACQTLLTGYRANSAVITATTGLATQNLAAVRTAWNTAAGND